MKDNNISYEYIDPNNYRVEEVLEKLNKNLDYLYGKGKDAPTPAKNLIPYSDFKVVSNIEYWKPYSVSKVFIKESKLSCVSYSNVVGVISPLIRHTFEPGKDYSIVLDAESTTADTFNECYLQLEDESLVRVNNDQPIKGKSSICFQVDNFYTNVRLVIGSSDVSTGACTRFKYDDRVLNTPLMCKAESKGTFKAVGAIYNAVDFDNEKPSSTTLQIQNSIDFVNYNVNYLSLEKLKPTIDFIMCTGIDDATTSYKMCASNLYLERKGVNIDLITLREEFLKIQMLQQLSLKYPEYKPMYEQGLDFIGYLYVNSPIKGIFPNTASSSGNEYSLIASQIIYDILYREILMHGDSVRTSLDNKDYQLQDVLNNIVNFIANNRQNIFKDYIQGAIFTTEQQLNFRYLDMDNKPSTTAIDIIAQLKLCEFLVKLGYETEVNDTQTYILDATSSLYPSNYILPSCVLAKGGIHNKASISIVPTVYMYKLNSLMRNPLLDKPKRDDLAQLFTTMLEPYPLYKENFPLNNSVFSYNYVYMSKLNNIEIPAIRDIYFTTIALCEGKNISLIPDSGDTNNSEQLVSRSEIVVDDDMILAVVGDEFIKKDYLDSELSKLTYRLEQAELKLTKENITAWVVNSQEWLDATNTIKEQGAQLQINSDSIVNKVWSKDIQDAVGGIVTLGNNLVHNSNFMLGGLKYYTTFASFAFNVENDSAGKTWCKVTSPGIVSLSQVCTEKLLKGKSNFSIDAHGRGAFKVEIFNGEVLVHTMTLTTTLQDTRYSSTFEVTEAFTPTIVFTFANAEMSFTRSKLCYGGIDIGWSLNPQDITELHEVLTDDVQSLNQYVDGAFKDGVLTDAERDSLAQKLLDFKNEKQQFDSIVEGLLDNRGVIENANIQAKLTQDYGTLNTAYTNLYNFVDSFIKDPALYDKTKYSNYYEAYILEARKLQATIQDANIIISRYEAKESSLALKEQVDKQILNTNNTINNLNDYVDGAFKDNILTTEEKERIKSLGTQLDKNRDDLKVQYDFISTRPEIANTPQLNTLNTTWADFDSSVTAYLNQVNVIYTATEITQDMRYVLNGCYDDYKNKSVKFQEAMNQATNLVNTTRVDKALETALKASDDIDKKVINLNKYIDGAFKDDILLNSEKDKLRVLLDEITQEELNFGAEIDYYINHVNLIGSTEKTQLEAKKLEWTKALALLKNTINLLLNKTQITDLDKEQVKTAQAGYTTALKDLNVALQDAIFKVSSVTSIDMFNDVNESLQTLGNSFESVKNFTDDAFVDGMISYQEFINLQTLMTTLDTEVKQVNKESTDLINNTLAIDLPEKNTCQTALNAFKTSYSNLEAGFTEIVKDSKVTADEKTQFDALTNDYKTKYLDLVSKVSTLRAVLITKEMSTADETLQNNLNKKVEDVQGAVDNIRDFSDTAFVDGVLSMNERESYKVLKISLQKEHLDLQKEVSVLLDSNLTPELVGQSIKALLDKDNTLLATRFTSLVSALDSIINSNALIPADKTNLDTAMNNYNIQLPIVREDIIKCTKLVSDIRSQDNLNNFVDTEFKEVTERLTTAEQKITPDAITSTVEKTTKTLVNQTYLTDNYDNRTTIEENYATKGEVKVLKDAIDLKVSEDSLSNKVTHISSDIRLKGINFIYQNGEHFTIKTPTTAQKISVGYEDTILRYSLPDTPFVFSVFSEGIDNNITQGSNFNMSLKVAVTYIDNTEETFTKNITNITKARTRHYLNFRLAKQVKAYKSLEVDILGFTGNLTFYGFKLEHGKLTSWIPSLRDFSLEMDFIVQALDNLQSKVMESLVDGILSDSERTGLRDGATALGASLNRIDYIVLAIRYNPELTDTDLLNSLIDSVLALRTSYNNLNSVVNNLCNL